MIGCEEVDQPAKPERTTPNMPTSICCNDLKCVFDGNLKQNMCIAEDILRSGARGKMLRVSQCCRAKGLAVIYSFAKKPVITGERCRELNKNLYEAKYGQSLLHVVPTSYHSWELQEFFWKIIKPNFISLFYENQFELYVRNT